MIRVDVKDLKGDEILAVPVMSASDTVLVQSDTELKEEYIQKLTDQRIGYVYVKEQTGSGQIVKERKEEKEPQQKKIYRLDEIMGIELFENKKSCCGCGACANSRGDSCQTYL